MVDVIWNSPDIEPISNEIKTRDKTDLEVIIDLLAENGILLDKSRAIEIKAEKVQISDDI